jgi:hypothetical protein
MEVRSAFDREPSLTVGGSTLVNPVDALRIE